jgi:Kdo2-lipid IVA lauroyltransferase/acyltransferase
MADEVRLKHRVEYAAFRAGLAGGRLLSEGQAAAAGAALGRTGYRLGLKKRVVEGNLRTAFPDADEAWISHTAQAAYSHLGRETMMTLRLSWMSRDQILERTRIVGEAAVRSSYDDGRGIILVAGHLGNWEIGAAGMAARGYPITAIAKRAANPLFYSRILAARERLGVGVIDFQDATRPTLRALREGQLVAFAADQHAGRAGLWVPFFGKLASTYRGPALMALRTGAPMYLSVPLRQPDGSYEVSMERVEATPTGDMDADVLRVTHEYSRRLEQAVRRNPEQYLWHHRRWRTPPAAVEEQQADRAVQEGRFFARPGADS